MRTVRNQGLTIELSAEQVQSIVQRSARDGSSSDAPSPAILVPSLRRALAGRAREEISSALVRGLLVLAAFPADGSPRRLSEIAAELQMTTSTVHRCAHTLAIAGLLERDEETRRYSRRLAIPPSGSSFRCTGFV